MKKYILSVIIVTLISGLTFAQQKKEDKPKKEHRKEVKQDDDKGKPKDVDGKTWAEDQGEKKGWEKQEARKATKEEVKKMKEEKKRRKEEQKQMKKEQKAAKKEQKRREKEQKENTHK